MKKRMVAFVFAAVLLMSMLTAQVFAADEPIGPQPIDVPNDHFEPHSTEALNDHFEPHSTEALNDHLDPHSTAVRNVTPKLDSIDAPDDPESPRLPSWERTQGNIKVVGSSTTVYKNLCLKNGQALDFTELGGGLIRYKGPEYSGLSNANVWATDGILTIETPKKFNLNVKEWVVTNVDTSLRMVELSVEDYDYDIKVGGKKVVQWTRITAYETISFGSGKGTLMYYEDETSTIPLFKSEGAKSYKLGFGNSEDNKIVAWTVRKCDPFHNIVEVCPYGLGGTRYTLLDSGRTPLDIDDIYAGMCIEVGASIRISTEYFNDIDIRYSLPNKGVTEKSIVGTVVNVPSPGAEYAPIQYWIVTYVEPTTNALELQPLYDVKPSFDYYYPTNGGTRNDPWHVGKCGDITAYVEAGTLYLNGQGEIADYIYGFAPWGGASTFVIRNLVVGEGITSLGIESFKYLRDLENVSLPSTLTDIKKSAFAYCESLKYIEIPSGVHTIGYSAFVECVSLKQIKIGIGLKTVQTGAFAFAPIEKVEYEGTEADWNAINIDLGSGYNDSFVNAEKTFGNKFSNATGSIIYSDHGINTMILAITAGVICVCAIICTTVYVRKNQGKKKTAVSGASAEDEE